MRADGAALRPRGTATPRSGPPDGDPAVMGRVRDAAGAAGGVLHGPYRTDGARRGRGGGGAGAGERRRDATPSKR
ncbi:hypothetical protein ACGFNP_43330 [Nonomuraea sp. NPDC049269]|uniref:hypothetical protein n=1 Tax=Nonomuraea sp. NPDC049269 TaxID=3364349 RepID=UPI00371EA352